MFKNELYLNTIQLCVYIITVCFIQDNTAQSRQRNETLPTKICKSSCWRHSSCRDKKEKKQKRRQLVSARFICLHQNRRSSGEVHLVHFTPAITSKVGCSRPQVNTQRDNECQYTVCVYFKEMHIRKIWYRKYILGYDW